MKSFNRYFTSFFYLVIFAGLLTTALIVGCGGGNNPGGPVATTTTDTTQTSLNAGTSSIVGKVVTDNKTPVGNVQVKLLVQDIQTGQLTDTGRSVTTLTSGEFNFNGLGSGTFVLKIEETPNFSESSKLAIVNTTGTVETGDFTIFAKIPDVSIPTLNLRAKIIDPLSSQPLSVAQVSLDSGQTTVTDAWGVFELQNIASGQRKLSIYQPGVSSYSLNFEVRGTSAPMADSIFLNNQTYPINATTGVVDLVVQGKNITINPNLHESGALIGTVKQFILNQGYPTSELQAYTNYEFDLWQYSPNTGTARRFGSVISAADGTWRVDQLPPFEDNGFLWFAVPVNTQVQVQQGDTGNVVSFTNSSAIWADRDPVLAYGYKVAAGQTTVMDFTVPSFVYSSVSSSINAIADASFSVNGGAATTDPVTFINDDLTFSWTGPGSSTQVILEFSRIYSDAQEPVVNKTFNLQDDSPTKVHSYNFKPSTIGLDFGRFEWLTKAVDPTQENSEIVSDSHLITVRPSTDDLTPIGNIKISAATYTVQFVGPTDPEASYAVMELYYDNAGTNELIGRANTVDFTSQATFNLTYSPGSPTPGDYQWRIVYYYNDGPPMKSEMADIRFVP